MTNKVKLLFILLTACVMVMLIFVATRSGGQKPQSLAQASTNPSVSSSATGNGAVEPTVSDAVAQNTSREFHYEETVIDQIHQDGYFLAPLTCNTNGEIQYSQSFFDGVIAKSYLCSATENEVNRIFTWGDTASDPQYLGIVAFTSDQSGNYYIVRLNQQKEQFLTVYDHNFHVLRQDAQMDIGSNLITSIAYYNEKLYAVDNSSYFYIFDMDGTLQTNNIPVNDLQSQGPCALLVDGNYLYVATSNLYNTLVKYDLDKDELVYNVRLHYAKYIDCFYVDDHEGCIYIADQNTIAKYDMNGKYLQDTVKFGIDTSFIAGAPGEALLQLRGICADTNGNLYLAMNGYYTLDSTVYKLTKTAGEKPIQTTDKKLVITACYAQNYLLDAIKRYMHEHPDVDIELDVQYQTRDAFLANADAAINKLQTKIMVNDVGDIVATGGMGLDRYATFKTDAFADLKKMIESDPKYSELNQAFLHGLTIDNEIKGLPLGVWINDIICNTDLLVNQNTDVSGMKWSDALSMFNELQSESKDASLLGIGGNNYYAILSQIITINLPSLINLEDKTANLKQDWFLELMEQLNEICGSESLVGRKSSLFYVNNDPHSLVDDMHRVMNSSPNAALYPAFQGEVNHNYMGDPFIMYSISNNSKNKELAWDFLSFLMRDDIQAMTSLGSIPLNMKALDAVLTQNKCPDDLKKQYQYVVNHIDFLYMFNEYIWGDVCQPLVDYMDGNSTLNDAIDKAQYNLWLRLNE